MRSDASTPVRPRVRQLETSCSTATDRRGNFLQATLPPQGASSVLGFRLSTALRSTVAPGFSILLSCVLLCHSYASFRSFVAICGEVVNERALNTRLVTVDRIPTPVVQQLPKRQKVINQPVLCTCLQRQKLDSSASTPEREALWGTNRTCNRAAPIRRSPQTLDHSCTPARLQCDDASSPVRM